MGHKISLFVQPPRRNPESIILDQTTTSLIVDDFGRQVQVETFTLGSIRRATEGLPDDTLLHIAHDTEKAPKILKFYDGKLVINGMSHTITINGTNIRPAQKQFEILRFLGENAGEVQSREAIYEAVWGAGYLVVGGNQRTLDVMIRRVRSMLDRGGLSGDRIIVTSRASGYLLDQFAQV